MFNFIKKLFGFKPKYKSHPEAVVISCFFNPQNSPYRVKAFNEFYESIQDVNHCIIECVIGSAKPQLPENENIKRIYTENLLWHKEALLNKIISEYLPAKYKYIFWVDADILFTNPNWIIEGVRELQSANIIQPFEFCVHLEKDETEPSFDLDKHKSRIFDERYTNRRLWRNFSANFKTANLSHEQNENYNIHGHVGFAWAAKREILEKVPLYDRALIGGADHIIAHAAAGQIPHSCITKSFTDNLDEVLAWSKKFYKVVQGKISYAKGDIYHIWHGDINKRQYLKRIQDFTAKTKQIVHKDKNGLYVTLSGDDEYMKKYFKHREVGADNDYLSSMGVGYLGSSNQNSSFDDAVIADSVLKDWNESTQVPSDFGGGTSGGGGASGSWDDKGDNADLSTQAVASDNFS
ncbi:MAG: hypothetical protein KBF93_09055 [Leptospiraceae bacterium]|nr:hypothetical protein [Leptospiraceae bacterium]